MSGKVLVIDDDISLRSIIEKILSYEGYDVTTAESKYEAFMRIEQGAYDVILADILLGDGTGIEVLEMVKEHQLTVPVVMVTGAPSVETAREAVVLGAYDYIPKPLSKDTLLRVVDLALRHKRLMDEKDRYRLNLEALFESLDEGIATVDNNLVLTDANSAFENVCGISHTQVGQPIAETSSGCNFQCIDIVRQTLDDHRAHELRRLQCVRTGREPLELTIRSVPLIQSDGRHVGAVIVIRDETRLATLERDLKDRRSFHNLIGSARSMQDLYSFIETVSDVDSTVLVLGETGTGKELVAEALHFMGARKTGKLVKVNCSALGEGVLESELFGHVKGAFTGAISDRAGRFEVADGGTLFLDEIGDLTPSVQIKLLRVLQEKEIERVGDTRTRKVDVRVIAATNRNLQALVGEGKFREDLYYRLKVIEMKVPPLRERREDIPRLCQYFIERNNKAFHRSIEGIDARVMEMFMSHEWPGNVRELQHLIEHACIISQDNAIRVEHLPRGFEVLVAVPQQQSRPVSNAGHTDAVHPDDEHESKRDVIQRALKEARWNKTRAAEILGISRQTLYNRMQQYGIE